jgi:shikimate kinase
MANKGKIVYLSASWSTLQKRLKNSVDRPLVPPRKKWDELKTLWVKRQTFYSEADIIVSVDGLTAMEIARNIHDELNVKE